MIAAIRPGLAAISPLARSDRGGPGRSMAGSNPGGTGRNPAQETRSRGLSQTTP